jgi:hypothetical protein
MNYTPIMWDVTTEYGTYLGYIEQVGYEFHPTASTTNGGGPAAASYEEAASWLVDQSGEQAVNAEPLVERPNSLTDPRAV